METVLIVGAGGDIAGALLAKLAGDHRVIAISRSSSGAADRWFETDYSEANLERIAAEIDGDLDLMLICNGVLHDGKTMGPEKSLRQVSADGMHWAFQHNVIVPALVLKHFGDRLRRNGRAVCAVLSARVGSIGDNRAGGWYGYRASKAGLNMLVKTAAIELGRVNRQRVVFALHPGTTLSNLSRPFVRDSMPAVSPAETADRLLAVIDDIDESDNGSFKDWRGDDVPW